MARMLTGKETGDSAEDSLRPMHRTMDEEVEAKAKDS